MKPKRTIQTIGMLALVLAFASVALAGAEKTLTCCGQAFADGREYALHQIAQHGAPGCAECGVVFSSEQEKARHMIEHHGAAGCKKCGVLFKNEGEAREHEKTHAPEKN